MSIINVDQLTVRAGSKVLISNVSLSIEPGTWCTIIGPNGAGKTTLVETVAGLRKPALGVVSIAGTSLTDMNERERAQVVSLVPQHPEIPAGMTVKGYVALGRSAYHGLLRAPSARDREIVDSVFERLSLQEFAERDVVTLSGGERQRMVLGRALAQSTGVIVLDEPITGLDVRHQMDLLELLKTQVEESGLTVVATMHDLTLAGQFADRLVLLNKGVVALDGPAGEVVRSDELAECYGMRLRVVDVDGADVVVPVRTRMTKHVDVPPSSL
jgi:iron complex transport system ATP-binding protein